jgi:hypothetical protein
MTTTAIATRPVPGPTVDVFIPRPVRRGPRVKRDPTQVQLALIDAGKSLCTELLHNPIASMIGGVMVIELAQMVKPDGKHQLISDLLGSAIETILITQGALEAVGDAAGKLNFLKLP